MTTLEYGNVTIRNVQTRLFHQEAQYDESHTDLLFQRFRIRVSGIVHLRTDAQALADGINQPTVNMYFGGGAKFTDIASEVARLRQHLMEPRYRMVFKVGGSVLLEAWPIAPVTVNPPIGQPFVNATQLQNYHDVDNGPKPVSCDITAIRGTQTVQVDYEIVVCLPDCGNLNNKRHVLSNRWSVSDSIDGDWYTTRTVTGVLRVTSVLADPQSFRAVVIPPLQAGFKRERIECTTSSDGLNLHYTIQDREVFASCPFPGTTWDGTQRIFTSDGVSTFADLSITVSGPKDAAKKDMLNACMAIANYRLRLNSNDPVSRGVLQNCEIVEHLNTNAVSFRAQVGLYPGDGNPMYLYAVNTLGMFEHIRPDAIPDYNPQRSRVPKYYGTATTTGLFVCHLQSPCNDAHAHPDETDSPPNDDEGREGSDYEAFTYEGDVPTDSEIEANYDVSHGEHPYTHYEVDARYETEENQIQLPISRPWYWPSDMGASPGSAPPSENTNQAAYPSYDRSTSAFVRLSPPVTKRVVIVAAERCGADPIIPMPRQRITIGSLELRLLGHKIVGKARKLGPDGKTFTHSIDAEYVYGLSRPPSRGEEYRIGSLPWDTTSEADAYLTDATFSNEVIT